MVLPPLAGRSEVTGPYAQAITASSGFLGPISSFRYGQPFGHHGAAEITSRDRTRGEQASVLVSVFRRAIDSAGQQQRRHAVARPTPAGPVAAIGVSTILRQLRSVQAQQANAGISETETVTIADATISGHRGRGTVQSHCNHCYSGQNDEREK